jgi:hypothetical protein
LLASELRAGNYILAAAYPGNADLLSSTSAKTSLLVLKK